MVDPSSIENPREGDMRVILFPRTDMISEKGEMEDGRRSVSSSSAWEAKRERTVAVGGETDDEHDTSEDELPDLGRSVLAERVSGRPDGVDGGEGTDGVGEIVGAVGKGGRAGGENLEERVEVLGLVVVLDGGSVHLGESVGLLGSGLAFLDGVDVDY
jgi:hypothetical protein